MKNIIFSALLLAGSSLFAIEPPKFLEGFRYEVKTSVTEDGEAFEYFLIEGDEYDRFKKSVMKHKRTGTELERNGLLWVYREVDGWDVMSARGFKFKRFLIVQE